MGWSLSEARTELVFIENGAMMARRYIEEVLQEHVIPFAPLIGDNFVLCTIMRPPCHSMCYTVPGGGQNTHPRLASTNSRPQPNSACVGYAWLSCSSTKFHQPGCHEGSIS